MLPYFPIIFLLKEESSLEHHVKSATTSVRLLSNSADDSQSVPSDVYCNDKQKATSL